MHQVMGTKWKDKWQLCPITETPNPQEHHKLCRRGGGGGGRRHKNHLDENENKTAQMLDKTGLDILNLSSKILTFAHKDVLSLGLSFVPNRDLNLFTALKNINTFNRRLTIKRHFWNDEGLTTDSNRVEDTMDTNECPIWSFKT